MSPPAPPAPPDTTPPVPAARPGAGAARRIDRVTTALLAASVGITLGAATPSLLIAAGVDVGAVRERLPGAEPPGSTLPLALPHRPPELLAHPDGTEYPFDPDGDDDSPPEPHGQIGLTRGPLVLHEQPAGLAVVVGAVQAGELVTVLRVAGDWVLVYYKGDSPGDPAAALERGLSHPLDHDRGRSPRPPGATGHEGLGGLHDGGSAPNPPAGGLVVGWAKKSEIAIR